MARWAVTAPEFGSESCGVSSVGEPCNFRVSSCFSWLTKLERRVACFFSHKETPEDTKKYEERAGDVAE